MNNQPAFPSTNNVMVGNMMTDGHAGMTLRDYFAAKALQSLIRGLEGFTSEDLDDSEALTLSKDAYVIADAMMKARECN